MTVRLSPWSQPKPLFGRSTARWTVDANAVIPNKRCAHSVPCFLEGARFCHEFVIHFLRATYTGCNPAYTVYIRKMNSIVSSSRCKGRKTRAARVSLTLSHAPCLYSAVYCAVEGLLDIGAAQHLAHLQNPCTVVSVSWYTTIHPMGLFIELGVQFSSKLVFFR